ncbi:MULTISPECIES: hypothetical protein [unclassified Variovorax]|uniref:hypothetical protein n=1 Tax=unclassified Variovorax TaxID=663243 RepID=UPI001BD2BC14|nr:MULTISPECIES: hypothetical protein [unclassified Variovorax]
MLALRGLFFSGLIAISGAALAAQPTTETSREDRMNAAQMDYQSGKPAMTSATPAPKSMHSQSKHHPETKK